MGVIKMNRGQKRLEGIKRDMLLQLSLYKYWQSNLKVEHNRKTFAKIADIERKLLSIFQIEQIQTRMKISRRYRWFVLLAKLLGFTFVAQWLMRKKERRFRKLSSYADEFTPENLQMADSLIQREKDLIGGLKEIRLDFVGAIILGMNDALVEITGSVAGFTLSMSHSKMIAIAGLIAGIAASLSMAASEFMAERSEGNIKRAATAAIYTGFSYILTVILLVLPFFLVPNNEYMLALLLTVIISVVIIFIFSFYMDVAKKIGFKQRFWEMVFICLGVSGLTFIIGFVVKSFLGISA
ncbi:hypothetical protein EWI07_11900 [Sporolactobacillus sp. THM7-4]|nr:hypothetical protein EWI07_11900 [Sporolactobacillus sp. THM7-4]